MSDELIRIGNGNNVIKMKDQGDGTVAEVVYVNNEGGSVNGPGTYIDASQSIGTSAVTLIAASTATRIVDLQNTSATSQILGYTLTGLTPVLNGVGTFMLQAGQGKTLIIPPTAVLKAIGSASSTIVSCNYI